MRPRYTRNRPTSKAGADFAAPTLGLSARAVLAVIVAKGGATIAEIAHELHTDKSGISARVSQLRDDFQPSLIEDSGEKRATISPVAGIVWTATRAGRDALHGTLPVKVASATAAVPQLSMDFSRK